MTIPYPNHKQIIEQARNGVPGAKLLIVAISVILGLDPGLGNGGRVLEWLITMAKKLDENTLKAQQ